MGDYTAFKAEIAEFINAELDPEVARKVDQGRMLGKSEHLGWSKKLVARGWGAPNWPEEWGGTGWDLGKQFVFEHEMAVRGAPQGIPFNTRMIGPILLAYGSEKQKERFLPPSLNFDYWWCQGYSEPSSGSDLASLKTKAVKHEDHYVVNGSKIWTTYAQYADWMFCLVRTDPDAKKQEGISFLLIDMNSPGIIVSPIKHFFGEHLFNQVFFDSVKVPVENRVGEENAGWTVAKALLEHERLFSSRHPEALRKFGRLKRLAQSIKKNGRPVIEDSATRAKIADLGVRIRALEFATMRALDGLISTGGVGAIASPLKLKGVAINQAVDEAIFEILGPDALPGKNAYLNQASSSLNDEAHFAAEARYYFRGPAIAGGSSEVQRGIIAKQILGL